MTSHSYNCKPCKSLNTSRTFWDAIKVEHVLRAGVNKPAFPTWDILVMQISWWVSWGPSRLNLSQAPRNTFDTSQLLKVHYNSLQSRVVLQ